MQELIKKLQVVEGQLAREYGELDLFALLERDDVPGSYDLVVAANWLPEDTGGAIDVLYTALEQGGLTKGEMSLLARVVPLRQNEEVLNEIRTAFKRASNERIGHAQFGNVPIRTGVLVHH